MITFVPALIFVSIRVRAGLPFTDDIHQMQLIFSKNISVGLQLSNRALVSTLSVVRQQ